MSFQSVNNSLNLNLQRMSIANLPDQVGNSFRSLIQGKQPRSPYNDGSSGSGSGSSSFTEIDEEEESTHFDLFPDPVKPEGDETKIKTVVIRGFETRKDPVLHTVLFYFLLIIDFTY